MNHYNKWLVTLALLMAGTDQVLGADIIATWNGTSGNWSEPTNWDSNPLFPNNGNDGMTFDAVVTRGTANIDPGCVSCTIDSLVLSGGALIADSSLTAGEASTLGGGVISGSAPVTFSALTWTAGTIRNEAGVNIPAGNTLNIDGGSNKAIDDGGVLNIAGNATWDGTGEIRGHNDAATINIEEVGVFDVQNNEQLVIWSGSGHTLNNAGTFRKSAGTGTTSVNWLFNNESTVQVQSGTLALRGNGVHTGNFEISPDATLDLRSGAQQIDGATFAGDTLLSGAALTGSTPVSFDTLTWTAGTIRNEAGVNIPAGNTLNIEGGSNKAVDDGGVLNIAGNATWDGAGEIRGHNDAATINIEEGGVFDVQNNEQLVRWSGSGHTLNNAGTFRKSAGTGATGVNWDFNNEGTVEVQSGTLALSGNGVHTGNFEISPDATLELRSGVQQIDGATFAGDTLLSGAALTGSTSVSFDSLTWTAGTIRNEAGVNIPAGNTLNIEGGSNKAVDDGGVLNIAGNATWDGTGEIRGHNDAATINIEEGGVFDVQNNEQIVRWSGSGHTLNNGGTFRKSAGTGATGVNWDFNNEGTVEVQSGTLALSGNGVHTGNFEISPDATLELRSGAQQIDGATFAGATLLSGAALTGSTPVSFDTLTWTAGTMRNEAGVNIPAGNTLNIEGGSIKAVDDGGVLNIAGNATWDGAGEIRGLNDAVSINIEEAGLFDVRNNEQIVRWSGSGHTLNNAGTFRKSAGTGATGVNWDFNNEGTVEVQSGTLALSGNGTHTGNFEISPDATLELRSGVQQIDGATFAGDTLLSGAALTGSTPVSFDTLTWTAGTIRNEAGVNIPAGNTLNIEGGSNKAVDDGGVLNIAGNATWDGTGEIRGHNDAATINIEEGGVFDVQNNEQIVRWSGSGHTLNNAGTFRKSAGTGATGVNWDFNNEGTVEVQSGTLALSGNGTHTGNFEISPDATLELRSGAQQIDGATFAGATLLSGAALTGSTPVSFDSLTWTAGTIRNEAGVNIPAGNTLNIEGGSNKAVDDGGVLNIAGNATWDGTGEIRGHNDAATINIEEVGVFDVQNNEQLVIWSGSGHTLNNAGTFRKSAGTGTTSVNWLFNNESTVQVQSGTLALRGNGVHTGNFEISPDATLDLRSGVQQIDGATFAGATSLSGAALTGSTPVSFDTLTWTAGTIRNEAGVNIPAGNTLNIDGGSNKSVDDGGVLNIAGNATWDGTGEIRGHNDAATINIEEGGVFDVQNNERLVIWSGSGHTLNNAGTFRKSAGTGTTSVNWTFNSEGTVEVQSGTLSLRGVGGDLPKGIVIGSGVYDLSGAVIGDVLVQAGAVNINAQPDSLTVEGNYTQNSGGKLLIQLGGTAEAEFDHLAVSGVATLDGTLDLELYGNYSPTIGDTMANILTADAFEGVFRTVSGVVINDKLGFAVTYPGDVNHVGSGTDVTVAAMGDSDLDNDVDFADFLKLSASFGRVGTWATGDFDGNGTVQFADFLVLSGNFGFAESMAINAVPEPRAISSTLAAFAILLSIFRYGRRSSQFHLRRSVACNATR